MTIKYTTRKPVDIVRKENQERLKPRKSQKEARENLSMRNEGIGAVLENFKHI